MKIFSWSIRGLNSSGRQRVVQSWVQSLGPSVGALLETHVQESNFCSVLGAVAPGWRFDNNYSVASGGRIWLMWSQNLSVVIYLKTEQLILCGVVGSCDRNELHSCICLRSEYRGGETSSLEGPSYDC